MKVNRSICILTLIAVGRFKSLEHISTNNRMANRKIEYYNTIIQNLNSNNIMIGLRSMRKYATNYKHHYVQEINGVMHVIEQQGITDIQRYLISRDEALLRKLRWLSQDYNDYIHIVSNIATIEVLTNPNFNSTEQYYQDT